MKWTIGKPEIHIAEGKARLSATITYGEKRQELYYEADAGYADTFVTERSDAFLVPLLPKAMMEARKDKDLEIVCEAPVSRSLYHQLVNQYIPILVKEISYYEPIRLTAETAEEVLSNAKAVGTGISGGVDSSYTIAKYMNPGEGSYRLTHGIFFNVGIYGGYDSASEKHLEAEAKAIAEDTGIEYLCVKSNTCKDLYGKAHAPVVPAVFIGAVLSMQKLFSVYYYSSGLCAHEMHFDDADAAEYDWLNVMMFSTESTRFYSSGLEATRLEKIRFITEYPFTYRHLAVCLNEDQQKGNCGRCAKCTRTMAELETIGALDKYREVFDVEQFRADPGYHWGYIVLKSWEKNVFCIEMLDEYKKQGKKLPAGAYAGAVRKWIKRGGTTKNRAREKVEDRVKSGEVFSE